MAHPDAASLRRPRRSLLWVPGDQPSKLERSAKGGADVVVLDLEDGVAPDRKAAARQSVAGALRDIDFGRAERMVRVCPGPDLAADLSAAEQADSLCLPKVEVRDELAAFCSLALEVIGRELPILAISGESPLGVLNVSSFAMGGNGVAAWMWGSEDLTAAVGCRPRRMGEAFEGPLAWARHVTVLLASATDAQAIDTVYPYFRDTDGLIAESQSAVRAGFSGKGVIHPSQVSPVNEAFTPSSNEIDRANAVVSAFQEGQGVATLDGQMLDRPHLLAAQRLLDRAKAAEREK